MNPFDPVRARERITALGLPPGVLATFDDAPSVPAAVRFEIASPVPSLEVLTDEQLGEYALGDVTPLWAESQGMGIVGYRHTGARPGYLRFHLEDQTLDDEGLDYQQILVRPLVFVWELDRDDEVRVLAEHFGFAHLDRLVHELETGRRPTFEAQDAW